MNNEKILKDKIFQYWQSLGKDGVEKNRKKLIADISRKFDTPEIMIEKQIAEWEAGKK